MPTLYWALVATFGAIPIGYFIYEVFISEMTTKSKRKKYFNEIIDVSTKYHRYMKGGE